MALSEGLVGSVTRGDGAQGVLRLGRTGELVVGFTGGRFAEDVLRRTVFHAAMQAGAALGTALTATAATLTLYNPVGSGVNLVLLRTSLGITTAPAGAAAVVYAVNVNPVAAVPSATTAAVVRCNLLGPATGKGVVYTAATLPAVPAVWGVIANLSATIGAVAAPVDELAGLIILPENTAVTVQNVGAACSGIVGFSWAEVPA